MTCVIHLQGSTGCRRWYIQEDYEQLLRDEAARTEAESHQQAQPQASQRVQGGPKGPSETVGVKDVPMANRFECTAMSFWMKLISTQLVVMNLLMALLVAIVISR